MSISNGSGATNVVVDVSGYFPSDGSGVRYNPASSAVRALDSFVSSNSWTTVADHVPDDATAVVTNVVLDRPVSTGHASMRPTSGGPAPSTSSVNATRGKTVVNRVLTRTTDGSGALYSSSATRAVVDVTGWFSPTGTSYHPLAPSRVADSRVAKGLPGRLTGGTEARLQLTGSAGVPAGARVVALTMTLTGATRQTHATVWQTGTGAPLTSDLNISAGDTKANLVFAPVDAQGRVSIRLGSGSADLVVDVLGYYG